MVCVCNPGVGSTTKKNSHKIGHAFLPRPILKLSTVRNNVALSLINAHAGLETVQESDATIMSAKVAHAKTVTSPSIDWYEEALKTTMSTTDVELLRQYMIKNPVKKAPRFHAACRAIAEHIASVDGTPTLGTILNGLASQSEGYTAQDISGWGLGKAVDRRCWHCVVVGFIILGIMKGEVVSISTTNVICFCSQYE